MGLVPEYFTLLGIVTFLAMSLLCALFDDELPSRFQYLFQLAGLGGLVELLISRQYFNGAVFVGNSTTDMTRFWISIAYLASAVSSVVGLNVYVGAVRKKAGLASAFSGTVTVPMFMISALFVSSFIGSGGEVSFTFSGIVTLVVLTIVMSLSIFGFLREAFKLNAKASSEEASSSTETKPSMATGTAASTSEDTNPKTSEGLHPAVAALKREISGSRLIPSDLQGIGFPSVQEEDETDSPTKEKAEK